MYVCMYVDIHPQPSQPAGKGGGGGYALPVTRVGTADRDSVGTGARMRGGRYALPPSKRDMGM